MAPKLTVVIFSLVALFGNQIVANPTAINDLKLLRPVAGIMKGSETENKKCKPGSKNLFHVDCPSDGPFSYAEDYPKCLVLSRLFKDGTDRGRRSTANAVWCGLKETPEGYKWRDTDGQEKLLMRDSAEAARHLAEAYTEARKNKADARLEGKGGQPASREAVARALEKVDMTVLLGAYLDERQMGQLKERTVRLRDEGGITTDTYEKARNKYNTYFRKGRGNYVPKRKKARTGGEAEGGGGGGGGGDGAAEGRVDEDGWFLPDSWEEFSNDIDEYLPEIQAAPGDKRPAGQ